MEVGEAVLALNFVDAQLDLAESVVLIVLEIGEGDLEDTALESIVGVLQTGRAVDQSLADTDDLLDFLIPFRLSWVATYSRTWKVEGALTEYQSLRVKGSWVLFLRPFLPLDNLLFLHSCEHRLGRIVAGSHVLANSHDYDLLSVDDRQSNRRL